MKKAWRDHSLGIIVVAAFVLVTTLNVVLMVFYGDGFKHWADDWTNNLSTELLNIVAVVLLTKRFRERGSAESK